MASVVSDIEEVENEQQAFMGHTFILDVDLVSRKLSFEMDLSALRHNQLN